MNQWEKKFGKYAIHNLSLYMVILYGFGYLLEAVNPAFMNYLTLNPHAILHGQIWRLVTWVLLPPGSSNIFFIAIAMLFYYSIGTSLERVWGACRYNVYIFSGLLFTLIGAFIVYGLSFPIYNLATVESAYVASHFQAISGFFSTYYVLMSIFLAYAATFPDAVVLFMFILPIKVKWLGIVDAVLMGYNFVMYARSGYWFACIAIAASLLNFLIFWLSAKNLWRYKPSEVKRRRGFQRAVQGKGKTQGSRFGAAGASNTGTPRMRPQNMMHKCAICGRTEKDDPTLEFRYCSKCEGTYEFCQDHLFNHVHAKGGAAPVSQVFASVIESADPDKDQK